LAVAIALSIAAHEVVAGLIPASPDRSPAARERVSDVRVLTIRRLATPAPRPIPTPVARLVFTHTLRALPVREGASGAPSAARRIAMHPANLAVHRAAFAAHFETKPVWDTGSTGAGSAGTGSHGATASGNGSGAGTQGAGTAAANANEPCGFVTFSDPHGSQYDSRTRGFYVDIRMSVHFADGSAQSVMLDYPWYYTSEAENPWSDRNLKDPAFPTRFQPPPPAKIPGEPQLVRYVMAHSTSEGMTLLADCPGASNATAPRPDRSSRS
jgi:hypothetical protein